MVCWRVSSGFSVLLRVRKHPPHIPRSVNQSFSPAAAVSSTTNSTPSSASAAEKESASYVPPRDDGDHDSDIDLITLRRRHPLSSSQNDGSKTPTESKTQSSTPNQEPSASDSTRPAQSGEIAGGRATADIPIIKVPPPMAESVDQKAQSQTRTESSIRDEDTLKHPSFRKREIDFKPTTMDSDLMRYLARKEISQIKSKRQPRAPVIMESKRNREDLDVDSLRPTDIRKSYISRRRSKLDEPVEIAPELPSGEAAEVPEHLVDTGIQQLKLTSSGNSVVIARSVLRNLIEKTITLSGAALSGEDVIIERYSPTWHRFARLLRTSDLHKISALQDAKASDISPTTEEREKTNDYVTNTKTESANLVPPESTKSSDSDKDTILNKESIANQEPATGAIKTPTPSREREIVILSLDPKKKKVISSRFRRLFNELPTKDKPAPDALLSVESLNKYYPSFSG